MCPDLGLRSKRTSYHRCFGFQSEHDLARRDQAARVLACFHWRANRQRPKNPVSRGLRSHCAFQMLQESEFILCDWNLCYRQQERHPYELVRRNRDTAMKGREVRFKIVVVKEMFPLYTPTPRGASPCLPSHLITRERRNPSESRPGGTQQAHKTVHRPFPRRACVSCWTHSGRFVAEHLRSHWNDRSSRGETHRQENIVAPNNTPTRTVVEFNIAHQPRVGISFLTGTPQ